MPVVCPVPNQLLQDPFFQYFFDLPNGGAQRRPQSLGSGVIIDSARGLVVTNHHVIENAAQILVTLANGEELQAQLIGRF